MQTLISEEEIQQRIQKIASQLNAQYLDKEVIIITILKGAICLVADLIRHLSFPFQLEFVSCSSYGMRGTKRGELTLTGFDRLDLKGKSVLLIDDICDTGRTLATATRMLESKGPGAIQTFVLLKKNLSQEAEIRPDLVCFDIPDQFVVGYGLDYQEHFRGLREIQIYQA